MHYSRQNILSYRRATIGCILVILGACGNSEPDVTTMPDAGERKTPDAQVSAPVVEVPTFSDLQPERGAWFAAGQAITVSGRTTPGTAPISVVKVNKQIVPPPYDIFNFTPKVLDGVNVVRLRVESEDDGRSVDGRSFFSGTTHKANSVLPGSIRVHLSPEFLDDDNPDLDDVASIVETMLLDPALMTDVEVKQDLGTLKTTKANLKTANVDIHPINPTGSPELYAQLELSTLHVEFLMEGAAGTLLGKSGTLDADQITIKITLAIKNDSNGVSVEPTSTELTSEGFLLTTDKFPNLKDEQPDLHKTAEELVVGLLNEQLSEKLGSLVNEFINGFAYETVFGETTPLNIKLTLDSAKVAMHGLNLVLAASVTSSPGTAVPFNKLAGSLATASTTPPDEFSDAPIAFAIDDDLINQLTFALWNGGRFSGLDFKAADFPDADLSQLPKVFQPIETIGMDLRLPVTITPRAQTDDKFLYDVGIGDLLLQLNTSTKKSFKISVNVRAGLNVLKNEQDEITVNPDARAKYIQLAVGCYDAPKGLDKGSIAALVRLAFPPLLKAAATEFRYPIPETNLSEFVESGPLKNQVLAVTDLKARTLAPQGHYLVLEGKPIIRAASKPTESNE